MTFGTVRCVLLSVGLLLLCQSARQVAGHMPTQAVGDWPAADPVCLPQLPPGSNPDSSAPFVLLQLHRWVWIENVTQPDSAPRTEVSPLEYYTIRQGYMLNLSVPLVALNYAVNVQVSVVTDGRNLCMAAMTLQRNVTASGTTNSQYCNSKCFNISSGYTMELTMLELTEYRSQRRSTEYFAVDGLDRSERASYKCMGMFVNQQMASFPRLRGTDRQCPDGDMCLFNYDGTVIDAGCKNSFTFTWCVGNFSLCDYKSDRDCPICCRGDHCNRAVADEVYRLYGAASESRAASLTILAAASLCLLWLRSVL